MTPLSPSDRDVLLRLARASIRDRLSADGSLARALAGLEVTPALEERRGAFVTLKTPAANAVRGFELRGCIGCLEGDAALYRNVIDYAPRAAFSDPRFPPLSLDELGSVRIEVSALTAPAPVARPEDLVVGRDGVQLLQGAARAVFLPQVAAEFGWSREQWLEQLSLKANLAKDAWRTARLESFRAEVFGEPLTR